LFADLVASPDLKPQIRMSALIGIADIDAHSSDWKTAIADWNTALEFAHDNGDEGSEAAALRGLGHAWLSAGSAARAEPLLRRSLAMVRSNPALGQLDLAASLDAMAEYYRIENKLALAEDAWSQSLTILRGAFGENHPQVALLMDMLADVYAQRGELDLAVDYASRASGVMRRQFGDTSPAAATALVNLAFVEQCAHMLNAAADHYESAIQIMRESPDLRPGLKTVMQRCEVVLKALHRDREAKALDIEAKAFRTE
jgi:tetratricopeptide (TPR) repeat protein